MPEAYVIDAVRTAVGKRGGSLAGIHPVDLGALGWRGLLDRVDVDPAAVDDVIAGCVDAIGAQAGNIARLSWLAAGYPEEVPGVTVDRQCGSSQQAISFGAQAIMSGTADLIVAGGVQNMSQIPISSAMTVGEQFGFTSPTNESKQWLHRYGDQEISQFRGSELIAEKWNLSREEMERYALTSHERAFAAIRGGHFDNEIITVETESGPFRVDEGPRESSLEKMAGLKPLVEGGRLTAAMASQISDGASAVLLASERAVKDHGLQPRARIHHISARAADPVFMLTGPIPATRYALDKTGLSIDDIDTVEINEAFAPVVLAWLKEIKATRRRSTRTAGRSRSVTRWAPPGPSCSPPCSTSWSASVAGTVCRRCARAGAPPTSPSSSGCNGFPASCPFATLQLRTRHADRDVRGCNLVGAPTGWPAPARCRRGPAASW